MGLITWNSVFGPEWRPGGIDALTRGINARLFENFESYANDAAVAAVWSGTNVTATLASTADSFHGLQSMEVAVSGGAGNIDRAINTDTFHFPVPGRIRYIAFKGIISTGSDAMTLRLSDASDANLYREWAFTLTTDETQDYIIDLYSGSGGGVISEGGFQNTESYAGPSAEGATTWDEELIDQIGFHGLANSSTFRFDDIRFYYEHSLVDAIGFGTEDPTDPGSEGSIQSKLRYLMEHTDRWVLGDYDDFDSADADANTARWNVEYIANSDGSAAGTEGGSADINTTTSGEARVSVDPDATPTQAAYAISRELTSFTDFYSVAVDASVTLDDSQATSTYAGLRISSGVADDAANYVLIARERQSGVDRITANAEFGGSAETPVTVSVTDNSVAFKIERYENIWNLFYSTTQFPNWDWIKLTQFEDASSNMATVTTCYLYAESGGTVDAQTAVADFDNWKYYLGSGTLDNILTTLGEDSADNIFASTNVASNRDGSVLERLENVIVALGTDGTTPVDSATSLQGSIGINDADNAFDSSSVVINRDGSVLERLEDIRDELNAAAEVQEIVLYPAAIHQATTELTSDGETKIYAFDTLQTTASAISEGTAEAAWSELIDFEQEGTITVIGIYAEFEWQSRFIDNAGAGTNSVSKIQMTNDGASWVDITDNYSHATTSMTDRIRAGIGRWVTTITAGANQLGFRLVHWSDDAGGTDRSEAQIATNSYVRITYRKSS
tara:strand:+ start:1135 stop:3333 length:2199 start_codon:yes stop_codon:yes gene_type:complete